MNFSEMDSWHKHLRGIENLEKELEKNEVLKSYYEQLMKFYDDKNFDEKLFNKAFTLAKHNRHYSYKNYKEYEPEQIRETFYTPLSKGNMCVVDYVDNSWVTGTNFDRSILFSKEDCDFCIKDMQKEWIDFSPAKVYAVASRKIYRTLGTGLHIIKNAEGEWECIKVISKDHSVVYFNYTWGSIMQNTWKHFFDTYTVYKVDRIERPFNQLLKY